MEEKIIKTVAEAPAVVLDKTIDTSKKISQTISQQTQIKKVREYWHNLGPGLTTGAADDDPSGIQTYSQAGAGYGFQLLWLSLFTFPLMAVVQEMCARIGLVTGRGLASNIRFYYPRWVLYVCTMLLFLANTLNIGADLGAMAKVIQLFLPKSNFILVLVTFTFVSLGLQIFTTYDRYAKYLKWLALILLSYVLSALMINLNWQKIAFATLIPSINFSKDQLFLISGILGTTISPYLFFWQTSQEVEEEILQGKKTLKLRKDETSAREIKDMRIDVWSGMFLSNLVMFFIIAACAATLNVAGIKDINTAAEAATALRPLAGENAYLLFALGIIGTGMLAVPVLAGSASYAISESFGWKDGLHRKLKQAHAFYGVIMVAMLIGLGINFIGFDPIKALIYSAVANGLVAPVVLVLIILMSSDKKLMGNLASGKISRILGWLITIFMFIAGIAAIISIFS